MTKALRLKWEYVYNENKKERGDNMNSAVWIAIGLCLFVAVFSGHHGDDSDDKK